MTCNCVVRAVTSAAAGRFQLPSGRRSSFVLDEAPIVMVDGVRVPDFHALETIDAHSINSIVIYDGVEGTTYYGTGAAGGVIVITSKHGEAP